MKNENKIHLDACDFKVLHVAQSQKLQMKKKSQWL